MKPLDQHAQQVCEVLRLAVRKALYTKQRLGQYAVFYRNGHPVKVPPEHLLASEKETGK